MRYKNYWYPIALKMVKRYPLLKGSNKPQEMLYLSSIEKVMEQTKSLEYGDLRLKAIEMLYFKHTHTIEGVALEFHFSPRTVQEWANLFVNEVGRTVGYKD